MNMSEDVSTPDQVVASFKKLEATAARLNKVSDDLGESITALDAVLKRLGLGVPAWTKIAGTYDNNTGYYWVRELGYAKVGGKWGIALRTRDGDASDPDHENVERWLFNDAPRAFRVEAIDYVPALLDELDKQADSIAEKLKGKIAHAHQVVAAVTAVAPRQIDKPRRK